MRLFLSTLLRGGARGRRVVFVFVGFVDLGIGVRVDLRRALHRHVVVFQVAAGHGLTLRNVPALVTIEEIVELNIGHAVIADAVFMSLAGAVKAMAAAIARGRK